MTISTKDLTNEVLNIVEEAGSLLLTYFRHDNQHFAKDKETISNNFVTEADLASEEFLVKKIKALRPNDKFIAEEGTGHENTTEDIKPGTLVWHIDPLDGTINFSRGIEFFSVSVAAVDALTGETILGVVFAPALKRIFFSYEDFSYVQEENGDIDMIQTKRYSAAHLLALGFAYESEERGILARSIPALLENFGDMRYYGSCSLNLCLLAEGRVDAYIETSVKTWDYLAAEMIAKNAGILFETTSNSRTKGFSIAAAKTRKDFELLSNHLKTL
jgi:myo-inositol-1(or 4)-monophosphatase